jgi:2-iminobutanoate/2-iminopropanoate deaminase
MSDISRVERLHVDGITTPESNFPSASRAGDFVYVSGQVSENANGVVAPGDIGAQTTQAIARLETVLAACNGTLADVVSATVFLTDVSLAADFNAAWRSAFGDNRPSRATVIAPLLAPEFLVEIQAVAYIPENS